MNCDEAFICLKRMTGPASRSWRKWHNSSLKVTGGTVTVGNVLFVGEFYLFGRVRHYNSYLPVFVGHWTNDLDPLDHCHIWSVAEIFSRCARINIFKTFLAALEQIPFFESVNTRPI